MYKYFSLDHGTVILAYDSDKLYALKVVSLG